MAQLPTPLDHYAARLTRRARDRGVSLTGAEIDAALYRWRGHLPERPPLTPRQKLSLRRFVLRRPTA